MRGLSLEFQILSSEPSRSKQNPYFLIGARTKNSGSEIDNVEYFKGFIDEIVVFDAALSKKEIQDVVAQWNAIYPSGKLATTWADLKE